MWAQAKGNEAVSPSSRGGLGEPTVLSRRPKEARHPSSRDRGGTGRGGARFGMVNVLHTAYVTFYKVIKWCRVALGVARVIVDFFVKAFRCGPCARHHRHDSKLLRP